MGQNVVPVASMFLNVWIVWTKYEYVVHKMCLYLEAYWYVILSQVLIGTCGRLNKVFDASRYYMYVCKMRV